MSLTVNAIYEDGVLKPAHPIELPEGTHVSLVIEATTEGQAQTTPAVILAAIADLPLESDQSFSNRQHDQALYETRNDL